MGKTELNELIERAKNVAMSSDDLEKQRRSFAFGNTNIENERITRHTVDTAAEALSTRKK